MKNNRNEEGAPRRLFRDPTGQDHMFEKSYEEELERRRSRQVECLGMTFENDAARHAYFTEKLRDRLKDPEFRKIEGFPVGTDDDIIALSDPPYYTACPNPFIEDFIRLLGKPYDATSDHYHREPFATDVTEGRYEVESLAHSYHTKAPARAIMRYILHYTEPGDIVLDGFCGSGMTGLASQLCGSDNDAVRQAFGEAIKSGSWGTRKCIQGDLSPAATFIASNYLHISSIPDLARQCGNLISELRRHTPSMYMTQGEGQECATLYSVEHAVWSDVVRCPNCLSEFPYAVAATNDETQQIEDSFACPHCGGLLTKRELGKVMETLFDPLLEQTVSQVKQVLVQVLYQGADGRLHSKGPSEGDLKLMDRVAGAGIRNWCPTDKMPLGDKTVEPLRRGYTHVHHCFTRRCLHSLAFLRHAVLDDDVRWGPSMLMTATMLKASRMMRYMSDGIGRIQNGVLYFPSVYKESNPARLLEVASHQLEALQDELKIQMEYVLTTTGSATQLANIPCNIVDYVFVDPPFGGNLMYSELNFIWEAWLRVFTNNGPEAITNRSQHKNLPEYQMLMTRCFIEYYRVLKPGRWMTVEFHNSQNAVWNAIQEALQRAGFVVADVRTLNKQQGSFNQVTSAGAVKQDIIISAYKPNGGLEQRFNLEAGTEEGAWDFARTHLRQLPVFVTKDGQVETVQERLDYLLFDRMVAFHVQRGVTVPLSAPEFYLGLRQRFIERDQMFFLPEQAAEYDKGRLSAPNVLQLQLFVTDEDSSIRWLRQQLAAKPHTFQDLSPQFMKEIGGWQKHEKPLELSDMLEESFLRYDGKEDVPAQIHSYLSSNFKDLRNLPKNSPELRAKAKDRWYVPDPLKAVDMEKVRERALLREFNTYTDTAVKRLKVFRLEAVRAGFKKAWQERDYAAIIAVARKIPESVLQEDPKLLMWYDQAVTRSDAKS